MISFKLSQFVTFIESHLVADASQYAVFHRLTGQIVEPSPTVRAVLRASKLGSPLSLEIEQLAKLGNDGLQIRRLIEERFLIPDGDDPLATFVDYLVVRPLQNPDITYRDHSGNIILARLSMAERIYSPARGQLPPVIEERMPPLATDLLLAADGTMTLRQIHATIGTKSGSPLEDDEFRTTLEFLTTSDRQLIKLASNKDILMDPFQPPNLVPRDFYHLSRWPATGAAAKSIHEFHVEGIEDGVWEFDVIEPTINHALRFPSQVLAGLDYGSRFCDEAFERDLLKSPNNGDLKILEVGGGTGSFACSFIPRAQSRVPSLSYQIMDLSPALAESQRQMLSTVGIPVSFTAQDATDFDLPDQTFDLIIANEVIADFPVARVQRRGNGGNLSDFAGDGAVYLSKYELLLENAPDDFYVNAGVFRFLERAWRHLTPGGTLILSEYGSQTHYPVESFHLNHPEFTIHFGHVTECARQIGYNSRLETLIGFLGIDVQQRVLNGREEHIRCLRDVFKKYGVDLPFALYSEADFNAGYGELITRAHINPIRFLPLSSRYYYGANVDDFFVLILTKPCVNSD